MAFIVKRDAVVIPAGIPVASVSQVNFTGGAFNFGGLLYKVSPTQFNGAQSPQNDYLVEIVLTFDSGIWSVSEYYLFDSDQIGDRLSTASGVAGYIPTSGWSNNDFTITAA